MLRLPLILQHSVHGIIAVVLLNGSLEAATMKLAPRIEAIQIVGNSKTKDSVVQNLSDLHLNQEVTEAVLNHSKARLDSSSLFETVVVDKFPGRDSNSLIIRITVKEKISWFIIPSFHYSESQVTGGAALADTNLFGRYKKGLVFGDYGPKQHHLVVGYRDPFLFSTNFTLAVDGLYRRETMSEFQDRREVGRTRLRDVGFSVIPGYTFLDHFQAGLGFYYHRVEHVLIEQTQPFIRTPVTNDGNDFAVLVRFDLDDTSNFEGLFRGSEVHLESQLSDRRFNSDFDYFKQILRAKIGFIFFKRLNLITHGSIQLGRTLPYYQELMVGGDNLRGYLDRQFRGDTRYSGTEEFVFPIYNFSRLIARGLLFWDTTVLYFKDNEFKRQDWHNGIGAGLRFYLKGIALPLLGVDWGYGIEDKEYSVYLNIGASL